MRKHYVDNIRWMTVVLVVLYHVIYMYNSVLTASVIGPFREVQYQDALQYVLYPWFMVILFVVSGMSSRYYLEQHTIREFLASRTRKLLVPSTIGLFVFQWMLGYLNMAMGGAFEQMASGVPKVFLYVIMAVSGTGVLWYIQMLWIFSLGLALIRKFEIGKLYWYYYDYGRTEDSDNQITRMKSAIQWFEDDKVLLNQWQLAKYMMMS